MAISQNMDDFSETQLGRVIIQNTYFKLFSSRHFIESEFLDATGKSLLDSVLSKKGATVNFYFLLRLIRNLCVFILLLWNMSYLLQIKATPIILTFT